MNPFETIKQNLNEDLHLKIPKKWKKIGDIAIIDFSELNELERLEVAPIYAKHLKVKTVLQKNKNLTGRSSFIKKRIRAFS